MVDVVKILDYYRVEYSLTGHHHKKGNVYVNCPFCDRDTQHFMGIDPNTGYWGCWWSSEHRGKNLAKLFSALLKIPYSQAQTLVYGESSFYVSEKEIDEFKILLNKWTQLEEEQATPAKKEELLRLVQSFSIPRPHSFGWRYLVSRKFDEATLPELIQRYRLLEGKDSWKGRLIIPWIVNQQIVAFTGRSTLAYEKLRYLDLPINQCLEAPKRLLYNQDALLTRGKALFVVEGQFDVMKLDFYGKELKIRAVGLSTKSMTDEQLQLLLGAKMDKLFDEIVVVLDNDSFGTQFEARTLAEKIGGKVGQVPYGYKDFGEIPPGRIVKWLKTVAAV